MSETRTPRTARPQPHPSVAALDVLTGEWTWEADVPGQPGATMQGHATFEWLEGGRFLIYRSTTEPPFPIVHSLFGREDPDDPASPLVLHYFDSRGVARRYTATFEDRTLTLERSAVAEDDFDQRYRATISEDGRTMAGAWERSDAPGQSIHHDFDVRYRRLP